MVTVILCVFLLSYVYGEGKSNYFKGSILLLTYLVIVVGFYVSGYTTDIEMMGFTRFETPRSGSVGPFFGVQDQRVSKGFHTVGRGRGGRAF